MLSEEGGSKYDAVSYMNVKSADTSIKNIWLGFASKTQSFCSTSLSAYYSRDYLPLSRYLEVLTCSMSCISYD
jgi:hypothetical protein